ncbi:hypothetical protein DYB30_001306 [Aphanomyces astaci]|uniref:RRM domain-containing protein n=2 Tax=Aphanomyces astaci TaxID=112090 RepID=A0A397ED33_APHAT|nr:hypothetical protein DYB30_001306 [Aphanomyces astaci]
MMFPHPGAILPLHPLPGDTNLLPRRGDLMLLPLREDMTLLSLLRGDMILPPLREDLMLDIAPEDMTGVREVTTRTTPLLHRLLSALTTTPLPAATTCTTLPAWRHFLVPFDVSWQDMKDLFRSVANIDHVEIPSAADGRAKGYALVQCSSISDAQAAIARLHNSEFKGRYLEVRMDRPRFG